MKYFSVISFLLILAIASSCSKSEEELTSDWNKNVETVNAYIEQYPLLKDNLQSDLKFAKQKYDEALKIKDKEARVEAFEEANNIISLNNGFKQKMIKIQIGKPKAIKVLLNFDKQKKNFSKTIERVEDFKLNKLSEVEMSLFEKEKDILKESEQLTSNDFQTEKEMLEAITQLTEKMEKEAKVVESLGKPSKKEEASDKKKN